MTSSGQICARHGLTGEPVSLRWRDGVITELRPASVSVAANEWLTPSLIDLQINGFAGVDFQQDALTVDHLLTAAGGLRAAGCTRWLLTLMTAPLPVMLSRLKHIRRLQQARTELRAAIVGWHLEGPFLSAVAGYCGAHEPEWMVDPSPEHIRQIRALTGTDPVLLTVAPERPGALECIELAVSLGMRVSLGHTDACSEVLWKAVQAGATGFTHLGNACPQTLDRHDNILWRALDTPGLTVSLIPDGAHVSPALFRLVHRVLGGEALYYTSDAVAAAGAAPGRYSVGKHQVEVGPDQIVRQPGKTNFAGSGLRPVDGIFRASHMLGRRWQDVWPLFSVHPSRFMGLAPGFEVGARAEFCWLREGAGGGSYDVRTFAPGAEPVSTTVDGCDFPR